MKLTKQQIKAHNEAMEILKKDKLKEDEAIFVMENWREDAVHVNSAAGAFFTPWRLARDLAIEVQGKTIVDLCAGIGTLSYFAYREGREMTCIELNPDYIAVGKKIMPEARWIQGSIFDQHFETKFDCAISNPPFGAIGGLRDGYGGFEFSTLAHASRIALSGAFILPQHSTPFKYSGQRIFEDLTNTDREPQKVRSFRDKTGIAYDFNCGIDTCFHIDDWHGVAPVCEICTFEFTVNQMVGKYVICGTMGNMKYACPYTRVATIGKHTV